MNQCFRYLCSTLLCAVSLGAYAANISVKVISTDEEALENMVVYFLPLQQQTLKKNNTPLIIAQKDQAFIPYISVGQKGAKVEFRNDDAITHHIYSISKGSKFNFALKSKQTITHQLTKDDNVNETEVVMGCNVHDWMGGTHLAVNTPYFSKTNVDGLATFDIDVTGLYSIVVWHPQMKEPFNRLHKQIAVENINMAVEIKLQKKMGEIPTQVSDDDFDYLSTY